MLRRATLFRTFCSWKALNWILIYPGYRHADDTVCFSFVLGLLTQCLVDAGFCRTIIGLPNITPEP